MAEKKSNSKFLVGISVALLIPVACYFIVKQLSAGTIKMPGHYVVEQATNGDTTYHRIADIALTNQLGERVSLNKDLEGKIVVVNFIYTSCPNICPQLTRNMKMLQSSFKKNPKKEGTLDSIVRLASITINPERDSFPALRVYADRFGANHDSWWFLTGDKKTIYNYARNELQLSVGPGDGGAEDFIHPEVFILLDRDRYVRGIYNGMDEKEVKKCADDIVLLTMERKHVK
jgi:protein SCO1/2